MNGYDLYRFLSIISICLTFISCCRCVRIYLQHHLIHVAMILSFILQLLAWLWRESGDIFIALEFFFEPGNSGESQGVFRASRTRVSNSSWFQCDSIECAQVASGASQPRVSKFDGAFPAGFGLLTSILPFFFNLNFVELRAGIVIILFSLGYFSFILMFSPRNEFHARNVRTSARGGALENFHSQPWIGMKYWFLLNFSIGTLLNFKQSVCYRFLMIEFED